MCSGDWVWGLQAGVLGSLGSIFMIFINSTYILPLKNTHSLRVPILLKWQVWANWTVEMVGGENCAEEQEPFHSLWTLWLPLARPWSCAWHHGDPSVVAVRLIVSSLFEQNLVSVSRSSYHKKRGNPPQQRSLQPDLKVLRCICSPRVQQQVRWPQWKFWACKRSQQLVEIHIQNIKLRQLGRSRKMKCCIAGSQKE